MRARAVRPFAAVVAVAAAALLPAAAPWSAGAATTTNEVYPVPPSGVYQIDGHGWGHAHGLNQWGAEGAAQQGKSSADILDFYYPGTAATSVGNPTLRVVLTESGAEGYGPGDTSNPDRRYQCDTAATSASVRCGLAVLPAAGLTVTDVATGTSSPLPAPGQTAPSRWGVRVDSAGLHLMRQDSGRWSQTNVGDKPTVAGPLQFSGPAQLQMVYNDGTVRSYRGALQAVKTGPTQLARLAVLPMDSYLYGVVPREASSGWHAAALEAQAVAARTYAEYGRRHAGTGSVFDICDSTWCQVFGGSRVSYPDGSSYSLEAASTNAAVDATSGLVRTYGGDPIFAQFSSSNGGWSTDGGQPYLVAKADPYDAVASPVHSWQAQVSAAQIQQRYPAVGTLQRLVVTSRDGNGEWGGRVLTVRLEGIDSAGRPTSVNATGSGIYNANSWPGSSNGLRSSWWTVDAASRVAAPAVGVPVGATSDAAGSVHLFDVTTSLATEWRTWTASGGWADPVSLGGGARGGPAAVSLGPDQPAVFVRGTTDKLYWQRRVSGRWSGWQNLGGTLTGRPAAASYAPGKAAVFVRAADGSVQYMIWDGNVWSMWRSLGGTLMAGTGPAATSPAPGQLAVVGVGTNGLLYRQTWDGTTWSGWQRFTQTSPSDPGAASPGKGSWSVFAEGADEALWAQQPVAAGAWTKLGGGLASGPTAASEPGGAATYVFMWGTNRWLYQRTVTGSSWGPWTKLFAG